MDLQNLIPALSYKDEPPQEEDMMMLGLKDIVMKALDTDVNVMKEAAAEAEKHRVETEKRHKEQAKKPVVNFYEKERDKALATHDTVEAGVLASGTQLIVDVAERNFEYRHDSKDDSHVQYNKKFYPGSKKMLFFTDQDGIRRGAWMNQLTMEEGNDLERQEISELLKGATSEEDKAYYTKILTVLDEEKKAGRTPSEKQYDAGWLGKMMGFKRSARSLIDDIASNSDAKDAKRAIQRNLELGPELRAEIEAKYAPMIKELEDEVKRNEAKKAAAKTKKKK